MKRPLPGCDFLNFGPLQAGSVALGRCTETGKEVRLEDKRRRTHTLITGQSGTGKTMLMSSMLVQDLVRGANVILLDQIGTLVPYLEKVLANIAVVMLARGRGLPRPERRAHERRVEAFYKRVNLLMLGEASSRHARFNPLEPVPGLTTSEVASSFASAMERILEGDLAQMRAMLLNLIAMATVLIDSGGATLKDMVELATMDTRTLQGYLRLLEKKQADGRLRLRVRPDLVYQYMGRFFAETSHKSRQDLVASTLRALNLVLSDPIAERWLSSPRGNLNLRQLMTGGGSLLVSLPPLNLHTQQVMGGFILGQISGLALRRDSVAVIEGQLPHFHLVIDEFQRVFTPEMAKNIAVYRNKGLALMLAHQSSSQPPFHTPEGAAMLQSVRDNCPLKITLRVGPKDGRELALEYFMAEGRTLKRDEWELLHRAQLTEEHSTRRSQVQGRGWEQTQSRTQRREHQQTQEEQTQESVRETHESRQSEESHRARQHRLSHTFEVSHLQARARQLQARRQRLNAERQTHSQGQQEQSQQRLARTDQHQIRVPQASAAAAASHFSQMQGRDHSDTEHRSDLRSHDESESREEGRSSSSSTQIQRRTGEQEESSLTDSSRRSVQSSYAQQRSGQQTTSRSRSEQQTRSQAAQEKRSRSRRSSEQQDEQHVATRVQELRQVRDYFTVSEEQTIHAQTLQTLPNRVALVLWQGEGEPQVHRIKSLDMPLDWTTRAGSLDGLAILEKWCTPQSCEPEPELNLTDRLTVAVDFAKEDG